MGHLAAEDLNPEFLKNFLSETLYLLPDEEVSASVQQEAVPLPIAEVEAPAVEVQPVTPAAQNVPAAAAIPKLPKLEAPVAVPKKFEVIGENQKGVVVLVTLPAAEFQALPQLQFLQKILFAIGLTPADVAFVNNVSGAIARFEELVKATQVNYIISFASRVDTDLPHDKFTLYNPVVVGQVPIVFSQSLAVLDKDQEHKKLLWNALKQVFH
ncbi:hypothetical protein [Pontibacter ruber]|uniref:Uncharacterized protein n=1 Tax=Pontibacter ruber TaxID=1343895 RepID=A0ABW5CTG4_9BACT|nr:hypothetical protein [Pontibacter ruber]